MASVFPAISGLLSGFQARKNEIEQRNLDLAREQSQREQGVFSALLASPDPEIRALAATGMLQTGQGPQKASGIRGWLGQIQQNPILPHMRALLAEPEPEPSAATPPAPSSTGVIARPPGSTIGQSPTQTTVAGQPGPTATTPDTTAVPTLPVETGLPGSAAPAPIGRVGTPPPSGPPLTRASFAFPTQADLIRQQSIATHEGDVEGIAAGLRAAFPGMSEDEIQRMTQLSVMHATAGMMTGTPEFGVDANGNPVTGIYDRNPLSPTFEQLIDPTTRQPIGGFSKAPLGRSNDREGISRALFGKPASMLNPAEAAAVNQALIAYRGQGAAATTSGRMGAEATGPISREERTATIGRLSQEWNKNTTPIRMADLENRKIQAALGTFDTDPNGSSIALIDSFRRLVDPQEGVGASSFAETTEGQTLIDRLNAAIAKYGTTGGQGLTKENAAALAQTAQQLLQAMQGWSDQYKTQIQTAGRAAGLEDADLAGIFGIDQFTTTKDAHGNWVLGMKPGGGQ